MTDNLISKRSATERLIIAKTLLESVLQDMPTAKPELIRCKDCKWFGEIGCAIGVVDDTDKPTENDFCSFAERRSDD